MMTLIKEFFTKKISSLQWKLLLAVVLGVIVVVGGIYGYRQAKITAQAMLIAEMKEMQHKLEAELLKAILANSSLKEHMDKLEQGSKKAMELVDKLQNADQEVNKLFNKAQGDLLGEIPLLTQPQANPQTTVDGINGDIRCALENFGKRGACKAGKFTGAK